VSAIRILAVLLVAGGILGLVYGGFTYTKETHNASIGPFSMSLRDKETVSIPVWAGAGAIVVGSGLLFVRQKSL